MRRVAAHLSGLTLGSSSHLSAALTGFVRPQQLAACRSLSRLASQATKDLPKTPNGDNAYAACEVDLSQKTTLEDITKTFKKLAIRYHPDRKGGSNDKMAELNAAYKIIKEEHERVIKKMLELEKSGIAKEAMKEKLGRDPMKDTPGRAGRRGGIHTHDSATAKERNEQKPARSLKEIEEAWTKMRNDTQDVAGRMVLRFELAMEQCIFFKKATLLTEITVRERWLRKQFIKNVWEDVHEMRKELMGKGTRNLQQAEMAEDMVTFASAIQKRLNEDYQRQLQLMLRHQFRIYFGQIGSFLAWVFTVVYAITSFHGFFWSNSLAVKLKPGFFS